MPGAQKPRCPLNAATNTPASANTATLNTARMMIMAAPWSRLRAEPQRPTAALVPPAEGAAAVCVCGIDATLRHLYCGRERRAKIRPPPERTFGLLMAWGTAMGETLFLLSCGAAFITGIVIAAASLFGG
jgi:hypothetical protein